MLTVGHAVHIYSEVNIYSAQYRPVAESEGSKFFNAVSNHWTERR